MKKLNVERLVQHNVSLNDCYLLVGQDPLLNHEANFHLLKSAKDLGFDNILSFTIETQTDWQMIFEHCQSRTLFSDKQLLKLILPDSLNQTVQNNLSQLIQHLHEDLLLVLQLTKLNFSIEKQAWYQGLQTHSTQQCYVINCQTPTQMQLPTWLKSRLSALKLDADDEAIQLLCYSYESNLLALKQQIDLLQLLYPDGKLSYQRVKQSVEQMSVFTPYQWLDAIFEGKSKRALRILEHLKNEDIQPLILLRSLQKELVTILMLIDEYPMRGLQNRLPTEGLRQQFDRLKIWQNKRNSYLQFIPRLNYQLLYQAVQQLSQLEKILKRDFEQHAWNSLVKLTQQLSR